MQEDIDERVRNLEEILSYQEQTIDALNDVIIEQQSQLDELENQFRLLQTLLSTKHDQPAEGGDPPPPHY